MISRRRAALLAGLVLWAGDQPVGHGVAEMALTFGGIKGAGWSLEGVEARLAWRDESRAVLWLKAARLVLPEPLGRITGLNGKCAQGTVTAAAITCHGGIFRLAGDYLGAQQLQLDFDYRFATGRLALEVAGLRVDGGTLAAKLRLGQGEWGLTVKGSALRPAALSSRLAAAGLLPVPLSGPGRLNLTARFQGAGPQLRAGHLSARLRAPEISNATGQLAGENLDLRLDVTVRHVEDSWRITGSVDARGGQLYVEPVYMDLDARPANLTAAFDWQPSTGGLDIRALDFVQTDTGKLHATGRIRTQGDAPLQRVSIALSEGRFPALFDTYLQPWLNATALADLKTSGIVAADIQWRQGALESLRLDLHDVSFDDREGRYGLGGLQGRVNWAAEGKARKSVLHWQDGRLYRVPLAAGDLALESTGSRMRLREPARIGVVDGELQIDTLEVDHSMDGAWRWDGEGFLTPVSLPRLCRALGWPEFAGKLSGMIPGLRYANGNLDVGGTLLVRVFDGFITLDNLKLLQLFSVVPQLRVDARVNNIALGLLTRAFSFGEIEGRLDGRVDGLYMKAWRPVAFDAWFATPPGDTSRHRISQKAVDNISSIGGGGVGGVMSRTILRIFEDFPYDKLGIRCRLVNGTCEMGGVAPAANGYYIVKGRLLPPRLNVIGYADRVDWNRLVSQLAAVIERQGGAGLQ